MPRKSKQEKLRSELVHDLCDLHTQLDLMRYQTQEFLERLDPTVRVSNPSYHTKGKMYWFDGTEVHEKVLHCRVTTPLKNSKA